MKSLRPDALFPMSLALLAFLWPATGSSSTVPYERMAPLSKYLSASTQAEIALARSAAPAAISRNASVVVLGPHGYHTAVKGTNGFTCIVERSWTKSFDDTEFWNPKVRAPICYNEPASRTVLLYSYRRTSLALAGLTKAQIQQRTDAAVAAKQLPPPEAGSMSYMMSKDGYLQDGQGPWMPHVMMHVPKEYSAKNGASWGADMHGSPIVYDSQHTVSPEPETVFFIPVARWSDGTHGPSM